MTQDVMKLSPTTRFSRPQGGFALLAVLWGVTVLFVLALVFSRSVQVEVRTALYHKEAAQAHALACGGVEVAIMKLAYPPAPDQKDSLLPWRHGQRASTLDVAGGRAELRIVNALGLVDLNSASSEQLARLLQARGVDSMKARELASRIVEWRSPASSPRESLGFTAHSGTGGEADEARHASFDSIEELLRVPGMTPEIFYGTLEVGEEGKIRPVYGVQQDLTVFSGSAQVNVNYASEEVLESVPGIDRELASIIVRERKREPFRSVEEIRQRLSTSLLDESLPLLTTGEVQTYTIISVGELAGSRVRRSVKALVQLTPQRVPGYRTVAWQDDYPAD